MPIFRLAFGPIDRLVKVVHMAPIPPFEETETARLGLSLAVISVVVVGAVSVVCTPYPEGHERALTSAEQVATFTLKTVSSRSDGIRHVKCSQIGSY